ncbi:hypothetical protein PG984_003017 [Apiospora sp. TS-2023a]
MAAREQNLASRSTSAGPFKCLDITVAFYVVSSIPTGDWRVHLPSLMRLLSGDGFDLLVGDLNLLSPRWGGDHLPPATGKAKELDDAMEAASMKLLTPKGTTTWRKRAAPGGAESTLDLAFGGEEIQRRHPVHKTDPIFPQDHLLVDIELSMDVSRIARTIYLLRTLDKAALRQLVKEWLCESFGTSELLGTSHPLRSPHDIEEFTRHLTQCLSVPFYQLVDKLKISPTRIEAKARAEYDVKGDMASFLQWRKAASLRALVERRLRSELWRRRQSTTGRRISTIYKMVKVSETCLSARRGCQDIGFLSVRPENIRLAPTTPCNSFPSKEQSTTDDPVADAVPIVDPMDIKSILAKRRTGAAMGSDRVPNFVLKTCRGQSSEACGDPFWEMIIEPYLSRAYLFQACLKLGYQPRAWKLAITIALLKPDKDPRSPRAWEAGRFATLSRKAIKQQLVPLNQFGFAGKSTVAAVEAIVNEVYRAWNRQSGKTRRGWVVTIMSLDIRGAYDNVRIEALIETLRAKGIPEWLSGEYCIDIGIPQGSPLSPILFLLFASPLLERFDQKSFHGDSMCVAFVDDMYLVVSSPTPGKNCRILAEMFEYILEWSEPNGVRFEGSKNHVMHLRDPRHFNEQIAKSVPEIVPEIEGMSEKSLCTVMRILGVFVDQYLQWEAHVDNIVKKVNKAMRPIRIVAKSTYGISFEHARHMYLSKVRTAMAYCAAAFYMTVQKDYRFRPIPIQSETYRMPPQSAFNGRLIERLRSLQYSCLHDITSAFHNTAGYVLMNELNVEDIGNHRLDRHPFETLKIEAIAVRDVAYARYALGDPRASEEEKLQRWRNSRDVRLYEIRKLTKELANLEMCERWSDYCLKRWDHGKKDTSATPEMWDPACLKLYRGLSRPACVMLLFCRSENLPVRKRLYDMGRLVRTPKCECGGADQTVQHLFLDCILLKEPREAYLRGAVGPKLTMECLLRERKNVQAATAWAIMHFPFEMFSGVRQYFQFLPRC